jgi:regulator of protease activity HflC (stomatin/prohibitin superfamily)
MNMKKKLGAVLLSIMAAFMCACSYETVAPNQTGLIVQDGKVSEKAAPGRYDTFSFFHDVKLLTWKTGTAQSIFTSKADAGDRPGDDSIPVVSHEGSTLRADVTVTYSINKDQATCMLKANLESDDDVRDKLVRPQVLGAFSSVSSSLNAIDIMTTRKGELANIVLEYLQEVMGQKPIPNEKPTPMLVQNATDRITQTHPQSVIANDRACGIHIESVVIPSLVPPDNIKDALNAQINAIAETQKLTLEQAQVSAAAANQKTKAEGDAAQTTIAAQAQAEANSKLAASLTPQVLSDRASQRQLEALQACADAIAKTQAKVVSCGGVQGGANSTVVIPAG